MSTGDRPTPTLSEDQLRLVSAYEVLTGDAPADAAVEDLSADERATLQDYVALSADIERVTTATAVDPQVRAKLLALAARDPASARAPQPVSGDGAPWWAAWLKPAPMAAFGLVAALLFALTVRVPQPSDGPAAEAPTSGAEGMVALKTSSPKTPPPKTEATPAAPSEPEAAPQQPADQLEAAAEPAAPSAKPTALAVDKAIDVAAEPSDELKAAAAEEAEQRKAVTEAIAAEAPRRRLADELMVKRKRRPKSRPKVRPKRAIEAKPASLGPTKVMADERTPARSANAKSLKSQLLMRDVLDLAKEPAPPANIANAMRGGQTPSGAPTKRRPAPSAQRRQERVAYGRERSASADAERANSAPRRAPSAYRAAPPPQQRAPQQPTTQPPAPQKLAAKKSAAPTPSTSTAQLNRLRRAAEKAKTPLAKRRALLQLLKRAYATKGAGSYAHVKWAKAELARLQKAAASKTATQSGAAK